MRFAVGQDAAAAAASAASGATNDDNTIALFLFNCRFRPRQQQRPDPVQ